MLYYYERTWVLVNSEMEKSPCNCLWCDQCAKAGEECLGLDCEDYTPTDDTEITEKELNEHKEEYRKEFFKYAEENGLYD